MYKGAAWAIEITGSTVTALDARGARHPLDSDNGNAATPPSATETVELRRKAARNALAAHALDRHFGLGFIPPTRAEGSGAIVAVPTARFDESARQESQRFRPNYCANGSAYDLLAAFDALIGMQRDASTLAYAMPSWELIALGNEAAFTSSASIPQYARTPRLPTSLRAPLEALTEPVLEQLVGEWLNRRQLRALLKRRDLVMAWSAEDA